ncbi:MAG: hypothetical protein KAT26_05345 [Marinosulfonomonas sp.]|nr:hypothetical protein [Marinosulfonomonas sp.]
MKHLVFAISVLTTAIATPVVAGGDLSRANVITVNMEMGTNSDGMYLSPNNYVFETGQAYKLVMTNVDEIKHELAINEMYERIFTRKIEVEDADGNLVTEVKGAVWEVEVGPNQTVEWFFVPVQTMDETEITCEIAGHYEAGMLATAVIN